MRQRGSRNNPLTAAGSINFRSLRSTGPDFTRTLLQLPPSYIHICSTTSIRRYVAQVLRNIIRRNTVMERHRRRQRHPKPNWSAILVANTPPREAAIHSFGTGCVHLSQPASLRRHPRRRASLKPKTITKSMLVDMWMHGGCRVKIKVFLCMFMMQCIELHPKRER